MNNEEYDKITEFERNGKPKEAFDLLKKLCDEGHPMAMLELSMRYYSTEGYVHPVFKIEKDLKLSEELASKGKSKLEELSSLGDGEAMRMLAYTYFQHLSPYLEKSFEKAEMWLLKAFESGCFFAANDLSTFYVNSDLEKAKYWYAQADKHQCRVIYHKECEH
ncbi:MAG: sel1 repeat family protein [Bacteroidetes bacterium]|nr:sel1 repeat family protein [Bacteroidota bacterium]